MVNAINGLPLLRATVIIPRHGIWTADVQVQSSDTISGEVTIELGGLVMRGTIEHGAPYRSRGWYRVLGGKATWRDTLPGRSYRNEPGVKVSTIVSDVARESSEPVQGDLPKTRVGPGYVRTRGAPARALDAASPSGWYVDELGITRLGSRPAVPFAQPYVLIDSRPDAKRILVAAESIVGLVPGAIVEGIEAATVRHELTPKTLRSHVYGEIGTWERGIGALRAIIRAVTHETTYHRRYEYRVLDATSAYLDIAPARAALGLPELRNVPMRLGSPGAFGTPSAGSLCDVMFLDGEPWRPVVVGFEGPAGDGYLPADASLQADGSGPVTVGGAEVSNPATARDRYICWGDQIPHPTSGVPMPLVPHASNPWMATARRPATPEPPEP